MASFSECWGQLKAKGYKHANGKEVLTDNDKQSILDRTETFKKEDGLSHGEAIRKSIQEHHDEAHAQVQSIHDQLGIKPVEPTPAPTPKEEASAAAPPAEPPITVAETAPVTSLKNAVTEVERDTRGLSTREEVQRRSWDEAKAIADKQAASDPNIGARLVDELNKKPRALDDIEGAHLLRRKAEVNAEHDAAIKQMNANPEDVNAIARLKSAREELQKTYNAAEVSGTAWGRGGKIRQALMAEDFSPQAMESKARAVGNKGKPLDDNQLRKVADQHGKIAKQEASIRLTENDLQRPTVRIAPKEIIAEIEKMKQRLTPCL